MWSLRDGEVTPIEGAESPWRVGSLQKLWVVRAWARAHAPGSARPPRFVCDAASRCWRPAGHGALDLREAIAVSCNAYFRRLARDVPEDVLSDTFREAGFAFDGTLDGDRAIGLAAEHAPRIAPATLLRSAVRLLGEPWTIGDSWRGILRDGLRDALESGTSERSALRSLLAKTGTVDALDGTPLQTSGWALLVDPARRAGYLALLRRGTGAEAAARLGRRLRDEGRGGVAKSPGPIPSSVRIRLFAALRPTEIRVTNRGSSPIAVTGASRAWLGPRASATVLPGRKLGSGDLLLDVLPYRLPRLVRGSVEVRASGRGLEVTLETSVRDALDGIVRGEVPNAPRDRRVDVAATVLRFLARGPRHGRDALCDTTHCARFAGFGPNVAWPRPDRAVPDRVPPAWPESVLDADGLEEARRRAERPGPAFLTAHCGGEPLSEYAVWGVGSRDAALCPRHRTAAAEWSRDLTDEDLRRAFGAPVASLEAVVVSGVRRTRVTRADGRVLERLWDEVHALLRPVGGWDALPSPPDSWERLGNGWRARGRGSGHRVGLCLAD